MARADINGILVALAQYFGQPSQAELRQGEERVVLRRIEDDPDLSMVLADLLFAAPELGSLHVQERDGETLVLWSGTRAVGIQTKGGPQGGEVVRLANIVSAVNALLQPLTEARFLPLMPLPGAQLYVLREEPAARALGQLGLLGTSPAQLAEFAWWSRQDGQRRSTPGQRRPWYGHRLRNAS
jgi:hypothetical protein